MSENARGEVSSVTRDVASSRTEREPAAAAAPGGSACLRLFGRRGDGLSPICKACYTVTAEREGGGEGGDFWRRSYVVYRGSREAGVYFS